MKTKAENLIRSIMSHGYFIKFEELSDFQQTMLVMTIIVNATRDINEFLYLNFKKGD